MQIKDKVLFNVGKIERAEARLSHGDEAYASLSGFEFRLISEHFTGVIDSTFKPHFVEGAGFVMASDDTGDDARKEIEYIADPRILAVWLQCLYDVWTDENSFKEKKIIDFPNKTNAVKWLKTPHKTPMFYNVTGKHPPENEIPTLVTNWDDFDDFEGAQKRIDKWVEVLNKNYHETLQKKAV